MDEIEFIFWIIPTSVALIFGLRSHQRNKKRYKKILSDKRKIDNRLNSEIAKFDEEHEKGERLKYEYDSHISDFEKQRIFKDIWDRTTGKCELCGKKTNSTHDAYFEALSSSGLIYYGPHDIKDRIMICYKCYDQRYNQPKVWEEAELFKRKFDYRDKSHPRHIPERTRQIVFYRDEGKCQICGSKKDIQYDHIIPFSKGGNNSTDNIQLLCAKCNRLKAGGFKTKLTATRSVETDTDGQEVEALRVFDEVIKKNPKNLNAWIDKGNALCGLGRHEEALKVYDKALEIESDSFDAWFFKGSALGELGRHEEALKVYEIALALKPDDFDAWLNKGLSLRNLGRDEESQIAFQRANELNMKSNL